MQRNGARLPEGHDFVVDFERVVSIDAGAGFGIVDGIVFTKEANRLARNSQKKSIFGTLHTEFHSKYKPEFILCLVKDR